MFSPNNEGQLPDVVLYTAQLCGIDQVFTVGGVQAIAAMTFGTESIPNVFKLFGPGNQYVTVAKQWQHGLMWPLICQQGQVNF